jgi:hypothetical protein
VVKGSKKENVVKTYTARSTLILSGEEHPKDAALNSRCILYNVNPAEGDQNKAAFEWIQANKSLFSYFGHWILTNKKRLWAQVDHQIQEFSKGFGEGDQQLRSRNVNHHSIIAGISASLIEDSDDFSSFIGEIATLSDQKRNAEMALNVFWDDIVNLQGTGQIDFVFHVMKKDKEDFSNTTKVCIWLNGLYQFWESKMKMLRQDLPASKDSLVAHLRTENYFLDYKNVRMQNAVRTCAVLDFHAGSFPENLKLMIEGLEEKDQFSILKTDPNQFSFTKQGE